MSATQTLPNQFRPLTRAQYDAIIQGGTEPGYTSPMDTDADYASLIAVTQGDNMDPRWPLAFTWAEGHDGSDPGLVAAKVNNLGGVKWAGQPGATDSGIPADTGGTYAAFPDLTAYYTEFVRIMHNGIIGPCYAAGDLVSVVEHYTNGPGTGHNKIDQYNAYLRDYPPEGGQAVVYASAVVAAAKAHLGQSHESDSWNGDHPVSMFCEADVEDWLTEAGVPNVPHYATAAVAGDADPLNSGPAPAGSQVFFRGPGWSSDDHTGISLGDGLTISGLATVQVTAGWQDPSVGYRGWRYPEGVETDPAPAPPDTFTQPGNPYGAVPLKAPFWNRWFALENLKGGLGTAMMGFAKAPEQTLPSGRRIQQFERGWYGTQQAPDPWDCVQLLEVEVTNLPKGA